MRPWHRPPTSGPILDRTCGQNFHFPSAWGAHFRQHKDRTYLGIKQCPVKRPHQGLPTYTSFLTILSIWPTSLSPSTFVRNTATFVFLSSAGPMLARPHCWSEFAIQPRIPASIMKERIWCAPHLVLEEGLLSHSTANQLEPTSAVIRLFNSLKSTIWPCCWSARRSWY